MAIKFARVDGNPFDEPEETGLHRLPVDPWPPMTHCGWEGSTFCLAVYTYEPPTLGDYWIAGAGQIRKFSEDRRRRWADAANLGGWSDDELYDYDTDTYRPGRLWIECPHCKRGMQPLRQAATEVYDAGWRWVGLDHREPYTERLGRHRCGLDYRFILYTPQ